MKKIKSIAIVLLMLFSCGAAGDEGKAEKKKRVLFVVNSISPALKKVDIEKLVDRYLDKRQFAYEIAYTKNPQHAATLSREAAAAQVDIVAAVGGDGTVNQVGTALIGTNSALAIIPCGSGNGLAKHLRLPEELAQAISLLNCASPVKIDTGKINNRSFLGTAGIGFDAHVAKEFARHGKRGFSTYLQVAFKEYAAYEPQRYTFVADGRQVVADAFFVAFANGSQYGNGFIIAPLADLQDGQLNLVIVKNIPFYATPQFLYRFKNGTLHHSSYVQTMPFRTLLVKDRNATDAHVDGEAVEFSGDITVQVLPQSLNVMMPSR